MEEKPEMKESLFQRFIKSIDAFDIIWVIVMLFLIVFCFHPVSGDSMYPTFEDGKYVLCTRVTLGIDTGDVVIVKNDEMDYLIIKRVIGMPGDTVRIETDGSVYVNGELSDYGVGSSYTCVLEGCGLSLNDDGSLEITLGEDEYWVMGDNRENSADSRYYGVFSKSNIKQKVLLQL